MQRKMTKSEVMPLTKEFCADCTDFMVGFARRAPQTRDEKGVVNAELAGSGTLVTAGGIRAILTAAHVLSILPDDDSIGLILPTRHSSGQVRHLTTIDMRIAQKITIARGSDDAQGPDLGLLLLSDIDWSRFPSGKIFFNLSKRQENMMTQAHGVLRGVWCICGMVDEWTKQPSQANPGNPGTFAGLFMPTIVTGERDDGMFDYISVQAANNSSYQGPQSFGGCSGGGLWQGIVYETGEKSLEIRETLLSGVAFYQSWRENGRNTITCHGRKSIYGPVIDKLTKLAG
jgi:hypothetical protein